MAGSPKKRARRLAAAGLTPKVEETCPPEQRAGRAKDVPSEPIKPSPADVDMKPGSVTTMAKEEDAPIWLREAAHRVESAEKAEAEALAMLDPISRKSGVTVYQAKHCEAAIALGKLGLDLTEIAVRFDVAKTTLMAWAEAHPDFACALARAHEAWEAYHHAMIREQLARPSSMGNATAYLSYMARRSPAWREKQEITQEVTVVHEDRVDRIAQLIASRRKTLTLTKGEGYEVVRRADA